jgi:peptide/nickel transport system substrate-binding protein
MRSAVGTVREVRKRDALSIDLVTKGPDPIVDQGLPQFFIMSAAWLEANNTQHVLRGSNAATYANGQANGTGPFRLVSHTPGGSTVLAVNAGWWGKPAHNLTEATFRAIPSAQGRLQALISGELDMAYPIPAQLAPRLEKAGGRVLVAPDLRTIFLGFDTFRDESLDMKGSGQNPLKDRRVREAFRKAIDLDALHRDVMRGLSRPTGSMIAPGIEGYAAEADKPPAYDPDGAMALLQEAGYGAGFPITLDCPNDRYDNDASICRRVAPMLARIGITVKLNVQPRAEYFEKAGAAGGYGTSFFLLGWTPPTFDGLNALSTLMTLGGGANFGRYTNAKIEVLTRKIGAEQDAGRRRAMIRQALAVHAEDVGHIPLHQQMMSWGLAETVADIKARPWNDVDLRWVTMR